MRSAIRVTSMLGAGLALMAASPAVATYDGVCGGKRDTPDIRLSLNGSSELLKYEFTRGGRPILTDASLRWRTASTSRMISIVAARRSGAVVARLSLRPLRNTGAWTGTLVLNRRTYWIQCDGFG